jgi:hypothetical protein
MKDILGQELKVGDRIAYARVGSGADHGTLAIGNIAALSTKPHPWRTGISTDYITVEWEDVRGKWYFVKKSTVTKPENMVKLTTFRKISPKQIVDLVGRADPKLLEFKDD